MKSCSPRRRDKDSRAGLRSGTPPGNWVRMGASLPRQVLVLILARWETTAKFLCWRPACLCPPERPRVWTQVSTCSWRPGRARG